MTTLTIKLSDKLVDTLNHEGVYAYAVTYDTNGQVGSAHTIVDGSTATPTVHSTLNIDLPWEVNSGKTYIIIQSVAPGTESGLFGTNGAITSQSDINWGTAKDQSFRYDSFEFSLLGLGGDQGNLTDLNVFGIPMSVGVTYLDGSTQTRGYAVNGTDIVTAIQGTTSADGVEYFTEGPLATAHVFRLAAGPTTAVGAPQPPQPTTDPKLYEAASAADWTPYIESLGGAGKMSDVEIAGFFNGAASVEWTTYNDNGTIKNVSYSEYHNPGFYAYTASWVADPGPATSGKLVLTPTAESQIQGVVTISSGELANSIYSTLGNASVAGYTHGHLGTGAHAGEVVFDSSVNTGANDQWGTSFVKLLTGFIGGYLGGTATALTAGDPTVDLSKSWNFDPTFAFGGPGTGKPGAVTPWTWDPGQYTTGIVGRDGVPYDQYAEIFFDNANSYGNGYSDALTSLLQQGGPLIATGFSGTTHPDLGSENGSSKVKVYDANMAAYLEANSAVSLAGATTFNGIEAAHLNGTFKITRIADDKSYFEIDVGQNANAQGRVSEPGLVVQANVKQITLTLFDDNEQAPAGQKLADIQGYAQKEMFDHYDGPLTALSKTSPQLAAPLIFDAGVGHMRLDPDATVTFGYYDGSKIVDVELGTKSISPYQTWDWTIQYQLTTDNPLNVQHGSDNTWSVTVTDSNASQFHTDDEVILTNVSGFGPAFDQLINGNSFKISHVTDTTYQITVQDTGAAPTHLQGGGSNVNNIGHTPFFVPKSTPGQEGPSSTGQLFQFNGLPYDTGVNYYRLTIGNADATRSYNMYMEGLAGSGILNPQYTGQANAIAVDNLASLAPFDASQPYMNPINIGLLGSTSSMDPALVRLITDSSIINNAANSGIWLTPSKPVVGTLMDGDFTNAGGSDVLGAQTQAALDNVTTKDGSIYFGWQGADSEWISYNAFNGPDTFLKSYSNKVSGLSWVKISFDDSATHHATIHIQADVDGRWSTIGTTDDTTFSSNKYIATMTEYAATDTAMEHPIAVTSTPVTFTADVAKGSFAGTGGSFLQLNDGGTGATGSWIQLHTTGSTLPNGTLLAYATDASGNLLDHDGNITTNLTDAVLARIGLVRFDDGSLMAQGDQAVYLPVGQQLHFAIQTGDNVIEALPGVQVTGSTSLDVHVTGALGTFNLSAVVNNTLSPDQALGSDQRNADTPWFYLTNGSTMHVELKGSSWDLNTVHFVRFDVDPGTGAWSVGGVAYGNTDAFRSAVQANWDNVALSGGRGGYQTSADWTVSKGAGFYTPVLANEMGNLFVIGTANVDGRDHIRIYGDTMVGFEDRVGGDFDYNDAVMKISHT